MGTVSDLALAHNAELISLGEALKRRARALWRNQMSVTDLDGSWDVVAPRLAQQVAAGQVRAASMSKPYLNAVDNAYGFDAQPASLVAPAFAGVMGDGREIAPALYGAVTNTKTLIGRGMPAGTAFEVGGNFIAVVAKAALLDMARNADNVLRAGKGYTRYIRVVNAGACSRCAVLAGSYTGQQTFRRHVGCQCTSVPEVVGGKFPTGLHADPGSYFDSLSQAEQDHVFTNAGAEAIRNGADPVSVVNARRGAYGIGYSGHSTLPSVSRSSLRPLTIGVKADGTPLQVYATVEGTTARGAFYKQEQRLNSLATKDGRYRRTATVRLMPEQIQKMAGSDHGRYVELLKRYGYMN